MNEVYIVVANMWMVGAWFTKDLISTLSMVFFGTLWALLYIISETRRTRKK